MSIRHQKVLLSHWSEFRGQAQITVSIVEDDAPVREILAEWIRVADGFKCVGLHGSVEVALATLPQEKPSIVLVDINMPGLSGIECVRRLKPQMVDTQFMMLSVYEDLDHIFKALSFGASGYLLKRAPRIELFAAIKTVHAGGSLMNSNVARKMAQLFQQPSCVSPAELDDLTKHEREVLELRARGYLYEEIAELLHISVPTVNKNIRCLYEKLHIRSRFQSVAKFRHIPGATVPQ